MARKLAASPRNGKGPSMALASSSDWSRSLLLSGSATGLLRISPRRASRQASGVLLRLRSYERFENGAGLTSSRSMAETLNWNGATPDCEVAEERAGVMDLPLNTAY